MLGHEFKCDICEATFHAGVTRWLESDSLPGASFSDTGDPRGLWFHKHGVLYCGPCSDKAFPEILADGVKFKHVGGICF